MKKFVLFSILLTLIVATQPVYAATSDLGADVALKVQYFHLMDDSFGDLDASDGVYVGIAAYKQLLMSNFFLGMEVGWAGTSGEPVAFGIPFDVEVNYVPIEFNAKFVFPIMDCVDFDFGGGFSINYFDLKIEALGASASQNDWVWGGQFFADINYTFNNFFVGIGAKYQLTEDLSLGGINTDSGADNVRAGVQIGMKF